MNALKFTVVGCLILVALWAKGLYQPQTATQSVGWTLQKVDDTHAQVVFVSDQGEQQSWLGDFIDQSPTTAMLQTLPKGQDNGLFVWQMRGCSNLNFVLTAQELKCISCTQPIMFAAHAATCPIDQQRLPVQGWHAVGLKRPS
jgi:hypothetical protein